MTNIHQWEKNPALKSLLRSNTRICADIEKRFSLSDRFSTSLVEQVRLELSVGDKCC